MVNLMTLKGLEAIAEREFEEQADEWVRVIADREGVGYDELRPHIVSRYYCGNWGLDMVFILPGYAPIRLTCGWKDGDFDFEDYRWYAYRRNYLGSPSFHGVKSLGEALLIARWAHDEDVRSEWVL